MRKLIPLLLAAVSAAYGTSVLTVDFSPPTLSGNPGDLLHFSGTLTNNTAGTVFLNNESFTFAIVGSVDDSPFFANAPDSLPGFGSSGPFEFLQVLIPLSQTPGTYDGVFTVQGGANVNIQEPVGSADFHVTVNGGTPSAPEPQSLVLMAAGLAAFAFRLRRAS